MSVRLSLDHASVSVPELAAAVAHLDRRLGLRATVSRAAPDRHSRVLLDRSYLEVSADPTVSGWAATMFFLRFADADELRRHLESNGIDFRWGEYAGVDGTWDDVELRIDGADLPTLIRRTAPADVASDWPPRLAEPHRCGARALAEVRVVVPDLEASVDAYRRLLGDDSVRTDERGARVRLGSGEIVLLDTGNAGERSRIAGLVLEVPSIASTAEEIGPLEHDRDVAWVDPAATFGLRLGLRDLDGAGRHGRSTRS